MKADTANRIKGKVTFRIAAVLFIVSALFELLGIASGVLLFGTRHGGWVGGLYHLIYAGLYFALGWGLWRAKGWGYRLVFAATLVYTLDRLQYLYHRSAALSQMLEPLRAHEEIWQVVDREVLLNVLTGVTVLFVACWWGFAGYTYARRTYFTRPQ